MGRRLIVIPRMYSKQDFEELGLGLPEDLAERREEFWGYVEEHLKILSSRISKMYIESIHEEERNRLERIEELDSRIHQLVMMLLSRGAEIISTEDPLLILEYESWSDLDRIERLSVKRDLLEDCMRDRWRFVSTRIGETLKEGETGVLFVDKLRIGVLAPDIQVIRMMPFDPRDYLRSWSISWQLKS